MKRNLPTVLLVVFLAALFFQVPVIPGKKLLLADCVFLFLAASLLPRWRDAWKIVRSDKGIWALGGFIVWMLLAVAGHHLFFDWQAVHSAECPPESSALAYRSIYDICVFGYMTAICLAVRLVRLSEKTAAWLGSGMLLILLAAYMAALVWRAVDGNPGCPAGGLFYVDKYLPPSTHAILGARFQFFFDNPNLLGSFYILPVLFCMPFARRTICPKVTTVPRLLIAGATIVILLLPLVSTVSKHAVASFAAVSILICNMPVLKPLHPKIWCRAAIFLFAAAALLSTTFRIAPLSENFPFINTALPANYAIHRNIYARMCVRSVREAILGHSPAEIHLIYPELADRKLIARTMESYGTPQLTEQFSTFMDPHIEYLNIAAFFGLPAMLFCFLFWLSRARKNKPYPAWPKIFVFALLMCCCWDDLLSKRWIWCLNLRPAEPSQQD